jgi:YNFM family putative membrane transporter
LRDRGKALSLNAVTMPLPQQWIERGSPAYRRAVAALFLAGVATFSLLYCVQPLLPLFAQDFRVSPTAAALALSLSTSLLALAVIDAAGLSDRLGRRGLMFASITAAAVLNLAAGFTPDWGLLLVLRALEGLALGGVPAVAVAYLAEEIEPRGLGLAMGLYVGGTAFGGFAGRLITGLVTHAASWRVAMAVIGLMGLVAALGFIRLLPPSRNFTRRGRFDARGQLRSWGAHLRRPVLVLLFAVGGLSMGGFVATFNYAGFRLTAAPFNLNQSQLGLVFAVYLLGVVASPAAGALADRFSRRLILPASLAVAACGIALTLAPGAPMVVLGLAVLSTGFFATHALASGWVGALATQDKGHATSLYMVAYYVGSSLFGAVGGWFWSGGGWGSVVAFTGTLLGLALVAALGVAKLAVKA